MYAAAPLLAEPPRDVVRAAIEVSIVVPVRDEAASIGAVLDELVVTLAGRGFEIVVVDDGSGDGTWQLVTQRAARDPRVVGVRHAEKRGKADALRTGIDATRGALIVTLDGDGQDVPGEIPRLLDALAAAPMGLDLVGGRRAKRRDTLVKRMSSALWNGAVSFVTGVRLRDHNTGLKVGRREVFDALPLYGGLHRFVFVLARAQGFRVGEIDVLHRPRLGGRSKYTPLRAFGAIADLVAVRTRMALRARGARSASIVRAVAARERVESAP